MTLDRSGMHRRTLSLSVGLSVGYVSLSFGNIVEARIAGVWERFDSVAE